MRSFPELTVQELHDVLRLREDIFVVEQKCAYHEIDGQDPDALHVLGTNEPGELVAYARILPPHDDGLPHVGRVVVRATERGKGHSHRLMQECLKALQANYSSTSSALAAQAHLEGFYASHGYVRVSENYPWDGIPHVDMVRSKKEI